MTFTDFAMHMWPSWVVGAIVVGLVLAGGEKMLLRIKWNPILKWAGFLCLITFYRYVLAKLFDYHVDPDKVGMIPWTASLTVFWEDICHGLPLVLMKKLSGNAKLAKPIYWFLLVLTMFTFGLGHTYQGIIPAILISFYIPFSIKMAEKNGFGTVIICHMMYDAATFLFIKYMFGL